MDLAILIVLWLLTAAAQAYLFWKITQAVMQPVYDALRDLQRAMQRSDRR